jgi:anaerobic selenocysteine-containing dehydrogenase
MATRRQFIRISAAGAGALLAGATGCRLLAPGNDQALISAPAGPIHRIPTYCEVMFLEKRRMDLQGMTRELLRKS